MLWKMTLPRRREVSFSVYAEDGTQCSIEEDGVSEEVAKYES